MIYLLFSLAFLVAIYFIGNSIEKSHYQHIHEREEQYSSVPKVSFKKHYEHPPQVRSDLALGSAVISTDYFKRFIASLQALVGGRMSAYESLVDRARREAVLRMQESVPGAEIILNVRIETSTIGSSAQNKKSTGSIEAIAYGTAIWSK
jgi:uncharacterized protein YbjQ (UPF0145 family)